LRLCPCALRTRWSSSFSGHNAPFPSVRLSPDLPLLFLPLLHYAIKALYYKNMGRFSFQPSIRGKITLGYYFGVAAIVGLSVFSLLELWHLDRKITLGDVTTEFFDTILEIRRFEKNYFLYEKQEDLAENLRYADKALRLIDGNIQNFSTLLTPSLVETLRKDLVRYRELVDGVPLSGGADTGRKAALQADIRELGKKIVTVAEEISKTERTSLQSAIQSTRNSIILLIVLLSVVGIVVGQVLSRVVAGRLKALERSMERIAEGGLEKIVIDSKDREIVSLTHAFNAMLREIEIRQRHLIQSEKLASLGTLMAGIAHEINNPLSNISTSCQILLEEIGQADEHYVKELLAQIEEQTDRARNIVRSLLDFSREKEFRKDSVPLRNLLDETIRFIKSHIPAGVSVRLEVPEDIVIYADKQRMQQAFLNLIKNAAEAITGEGAIMISARRHTPTDDNRVSDGRSFAYATDHGRCIDSGSTVDITVRDTGPGIPPEILPKIFDPFFTTKDVGKGSGLGLSIVHEIIEEHGGCIAVDSTVGKGTTFLIRLPAKE